MTSTQKHCDLAHQSHLKKKIFSKDTCTIAFEKDFLILLHVSLLNTRSFSHLINQSNEKLMFSTT